MNTEEIKQELVKCYKLAAKYKLDDLVFGHISHRDQDGYWIKEPMLPFDMVTMDNLKFIKLTDPIKPFSDFGIHSKVYLQIPKKQAIMHIHTTDICAMAATELKLLNISQPASLINTSYTEYAYESNLLFNNEFLDLLDCIQNYEFVMMKNHGFMTSGKSLMHVFFNSYMFDQACKIQLVTPMPKEMSGEMISSTRELKLLLKYHQTRTELWKNLTQNL